MSIKEYQIRCFKDYKQSIGLTSQCQYINGASINAIVPIETSINNIMIIGAYPTAKFAHINGDDNVPINDIDFPFSNQTYFDGSKVRKVISGDELQEHYLLPLNIDRKQCWITNIVKTFLFKEGHVKKYRRLGNTNIIQLHDKFKELAKQSLPWIIEEIRLAKPKVILMIGLQVTSVMFDKTDKCSKSLLDGKIHILTIGETNYKAICFPHPGILIRKYERNPWPGKFETEIIPNAYRELRSLGF